MKKVLFLLFTITLFSCSSDSGDIEKAKSVSENWIKENVLPLYNESENPVILSSRKDIESETNFDYLSEKYKWKGTLESNEYNFSDNSERALLAHKIYDNYSILSIATDITDEKIAYKSYLYEWTQRAAKLLESSDCEMNINNTQNFYVIRFFVKHKDNNPENTTDKFLFDRIDVILDDNFNVINKIK